MEPVAVRAAGGSSSGRISNALGSGERFDMISRPRFEDRTLRGHRPLRNSRSVFPVLTFLFAAP